MESQLLNTLLDFKFIATEIMIILGWEASSDFTVSYCENDDEGMGVILMFQMRHGPENIGHTELNNIYNLLPEFDEVSFYEGDDGWQLWITIPAEE